MNESPTNERPPELEALLGPPGNRGSDESDADFDLGALWGSLQERVAEDEETTQSKIRSLSTPKRNMTALLSFGVVLGGTITLMPRRDLSEYPLPLLALYVGCLGVLLLLALAAVLRPAHKPHLPPWQSKALTGVAIAATTVLALVPNLHAHAEVRPFGLMTIAPCALFGLGVGLPIYGLLRLLDRGNPFGRVVAAAAAGLMANIALELKCPYGGAAHLVVGHVMVLVFFVAGALLADRLADKVGS